MSEFKFVKSKNYDTKTLDNSEQAIEDLTEKWYTLDSSFNNLIDDDDNYSILIGLLTQAQNRLSAGTETKNKEK